jgi:cellulose synthase/poly-beta-1,6-N-acetylglucosamine synthase-like glycosyltransferase
VLLPALLLVSVQIGFWVALLAGLVRRSRHAQAGASHPVSVIICAHDEEANLRELLPLLLAQQYPDFEIIVVDDRSNDGTYDYLLGLTRAEPCIRMVRVRETPGHLPGKKFALTLGIRAARHEVILVTDADCRPVSAQWIAGMAQHLAAGVDFVLGLSPYRRLPGWLNRFIRYEAWLTAIFMAGFARLGMPYMGVGRNLLYRKELFFKSKGFNRHLQVVSGDDDLFVNEHARAGNTAVCFAPNSLMVSGPKRSWREFFTQKVRHLSAGKHYRPAHRAVLGLYAVSQTAMWLALPPALMYPGQIPAAGLAGLFLVRWFCQMAAVRLMTKRVNMPFEWGWVPVLDFVYALYYLVAGARAALTKKVRWKN